MHKRKNDAGGKEEMEETERIMPRKKPYNMRAATARGNGRAVYKSKNALDDVRFCLLLGRVVPAARKTR